MYYISKQTYTKNEVVKWPIPNYWDFIAITIIFSFIISIMWCWKQMVGSYHLGETITLSLNPIYLPLYSIRTTIRLFVAMFFSILSTFIFGTLAAKNKHAEQIIIPIIDVLQSVPILSFLSITITGFLFIFKNNIFGLECASIFSVFTSQVWNMILSFYLGIKTVPREFIEVADIFHLSKWQKFWKIEVPYSMSRLLWNMMISMSGSWFFVIACEAFYVAGNKVNLPGIGSYIAVAIEMSSYRCILYAIISMLTVIFLYDQLLFRPLVYWNAKFKEFHDDDERIHRPWLINLFQRTKFLRLTTMKIIQFFELLINVKKRNVKSISNNDKKFNHTFNIIYNVVLYILIAIAILGIANFIFIKTSWLELRKVIICGIFTFIRVMSLITLSSLICVPIGVFIGLRPRLTTIVQPIIQFAAAFPANLLFPIIIILIIKLKLNVEIWVSPLMVLGTQWYILFNVITGTNSLPKELKLAAANFKVKGILWWKRLILPGIAPDLITGIITATGGAWNASIVAETINWGSTTLYATGLGSYIKINSIANDFNRVSLGTIVMCSIILLINRLFWRPLYNIIIEKYKLN